MIPTEILTMLGSGLITAYVRLKAADMKQRHEEVKAFARQQKTISENLNQAAERAGGAFASCIRGLIVICLMTVFIFPTIAPAFIDDMRVYITHYEEGRKILGIFGQLADKLRFVELKDGIVVLPEFKHMTAAVMGFFFGTAATRS